MLSQVQGLLTRGLPLAKGACAASLVAALRSFSSAGGSVPKTAKSLVFSEFGNPEDVLSLESHPLREPGEGEVVINILAVRRRRSGGGPRDQAASLCSFLRACIYSAPRLRLPGDALARPRAPPARCPRPPALACRRPSTPATSTPSRASTRCGRTCRACLATRGWGWWRRWGPRCAAGGGSAAAPAAGGMTHTTNLSRRPPIHPLTPQVVQRPPAACPLPGQRSLTRQHRTEGSSACLASSFFMTGGRRWGRPVVTPARTPAPRHREKAV